MRRGVEGRLECGGDFAGIFAQRLCQLQRDIGRPVAVARLFGALQRRDGRVAQARALDARSQPFN